VTNYGLIRANNVTMTLPKNLPLVRLEFQVPFQAFNLNANTSVIIRVNVLQTQAKNKPIRTDDNGCIFGILLSKERF